MEQKKVSVFLKNYNRLVCTAAGKTLLEVFREAGLDLETPCDGRGTCGKCRVKAGGRLNEKTAKELEKLDGNACARTRLVCQVRVLGDATVELPDSRGGDFAGLVRGEEKWGQSGVSSGRRGAAAAKKATDYVSPCQDAGNGRKHLGIALDIGTTGIAAELVDLKTGELLGAETCLNPQVIYGGDVMTRITFAGKDRDGTRKLQAKAVQGINLLLENLCSKNRVKNSDIHEMVVAANNVMLHLLLGINPAPLAVVPYTPVFTNMRAVKPESLGVQIAPGGKMILLPSASAFVGSDIMAGLLACNFHYQHEPSLFIDIGTNGEIAVAKEGLIAGTSSAAGPAFEGMNISCGCRAEKGAVEQVFIFGDGRIELKTIGGERPRGICGSGLLDLMAELLKNGVIQPSGRFSKPPAETFAERLLKQNGRYIFRVDEEGRIHISQKDIREFQLAKGALAAGIILLFKELDMTWEKIKKVFIAGAFGYYLNPASLVAVGIIPPHLKDKIEFLGNTAIDGALKCLLNKAAFSEINDIQGKIVIHELTFQADFQKYFVKCLSFPAYNKIDTINSVNLGNHRDYAGQAPESEKGVRLEN